MYELFALYKHYGSCCYLFRFTRIRNRMFYEMKQLFRQSLMDVDVTLNLNYDFEIAMKNFDGTE
jgi:hypothetical protein